MSASRAGKPSRKERGAFPFPPQPGTNTQGLGADCRPQHWGQGITIACCPMPVPGWEAHTRLCPLPRGPSRPLPGHGARGKGTQHFLVVLTYYCEMRVLSRFSGVRLFLTPWTSPPGSSVHGIFQLRLLEWVALPSSRQSPRPRALAHVSLRLLRLRRVLYHWGHLD